MSHFFTGLKCTCDQKGCTINEVFENPGNVTIMVLLGMAEKGGWYIPMSNGGKTWCPMHHKAVAKRFGWDSLYETSKPRGVPIERDDKGSSSKDREE